MTPTCLSAPPMLALVLAFGLGACTAVTPDATRNVPVEATTGTLLTASPGTAAAANTAFSIVVPDYAVTAINVTVPKSLRVSEANMYYPIADIVWRGEPRGDRHVQIKAIFDEAMATGIAGFTDGRAVVVDVEVTRFHCLTEKARYTVGGVHSVKFNMTVRDAATGAVIDGPRLVIADIRASGGAIAVEEEAQGITQRLVIKQNLAQVIERELSRPVAVPGAPTGPALSRGTFDPTDLAL